MKEVKKTGPSKNVTAAKKKPVNNSKPMNKKPVNKHVDNDAPRVTKIESPVKEAKVVDLDNDFMEDDNDQKLIVVIAIALLVILATVIGLLVGCEKKEEDEPEPNDDEIVVPVEDDENEDNEDDVVVKTTTTKVTDKDDEESKEDVVISTFDITYHYSLNERTHHESVSEGNSANEYVPQGYSACKYYADEGFEEEYTFDNIYEDTNIYLDCESIEYSVVYRFDENDNTNNDLNPTTFTVEDTVELKDLETTEIFMGWYLDNEYTNRVYELGRDLIKHADSENTVYLYAKVAQEATIKLYDENSELVLTETLNKQTSMNYTLPEAADINVCANSTFLGWALVEGSRNVDYKDGANLNVDKDYNLYAVCGDATIQYVSNGEMVTVAYTKEELAEAEFDLPAPTDMNMEVPSYFVPVTEDVLNSLKIVSDDELELADNEIYYSDVVGNTREDYTPNVGDKVQAFEKEFVGWVEKSNEVETPETDSTVSNGESSDVDTTQTEDTTIDSETDEVTEEIDLVTKEEVVEKVENGETEVELEAVWEIPEEDPVEDEVVTASVEVETVVEELPTI